MQPVRSSVLAMVTWSTEADLVRASPHADLLLTDLPQLVDLGSLARNSALDHLNASSHGCTNGQSIRGSNGLDLDDTDSRVIFTSVVLAVTLIAHPGLQCRGVVLLHGLAVGEDACGAGDGGPAAVWRDEGDVDVGVVVDVVGLAGLGVGVKEVVDATRFLSRGVRLAYLLPILKTNGT